MGVRLAVARPQTWAGQGRHQTGAKAILVVSVDGALVYHPTQ
jgi:hypothetical protein